MKNIIKLFFIFILLIPIYINAAVNIEYEISKEHANDYIKNYMDIKNI